MSQHTCSSLKNQVARFLRSGTTRQYDMEMMACLLKDIERLPINQVSVRLVMQEIALHTLQVDVEVN